MTIFTEMRNGQQKKRNTIISKKKVTIEEYIKNTNQDAQITPGEIVTFVNKDAIRRNLIWANYDRLANAGETKKGNIKYYQKDKPGFCLDAARLRFEYCNFIFETQGYRDLLWTPSKKIAPGIIGNTCWIMPSQFKTYVLTYQVDHVLPIAAGGKDDIENYAFLTANGNMFTKNQLKLILLGGLYGGFFNNRINEIMQNRDDLFSSDVWRVFKQELTDFENS